MSRRKPLTVSSPAWRRVSGRQFARGRLSIGRSHRSRTRLRRVLLQIRLRTLHNLPLVVFTLELIVHGEALLRRAALGNERNHSIGLLAAERNGNHVNVHSLDVDVLRHAPDDALPHRIGRIDVFAAAVRQQQKCQNTGEDQFHDPIIPAETIASTTPAVVKTLASVPT